MVLLKLLATAVVLQGGATPKEIWDNCQKKLRQASTVSGVFYLASNTDRSQKIEFRLAKDNRFAMIGTTMSDYFDGTTHYRVDASKKTYEMRNPKLFGVPTIIGFEAFIRATEDYPLSEGPLYAAARFVDQEGKKLVEVSYTDGKDSIQVFVDPQSELPSGWNWIRGNNRAVARFKDVVLNAPLATDAFSFQPSGDYTNTTGESERVFSKVKVGDDAPDIIDISPKSKKTLSTVRSKARPTVVAFINAKQQASGEAIVQMGTLFAKFKKSGTQIVFVTVGMSQSEVNVMNKIYKISVPVLNSGLTNAVKEAYDINVLPSTFILDKNGKVRYRASGFDIDEVEEKLESLAG
jgi:peroxiredoxin